MLTKEELAQKIARLSAIDNYEISVRTRMTHSHFVLPAVMLQERNQLLSELEDTRHPYLKIRRERFENQARGRKGGKKQ